MALEQKLSLKLAQKLVMTPSLQQAIKLLQMTKLELEGVLTQELVENPVLEENEPDEEAPAEETAAEEAPEDNALSDVDLEAFFGDYAESWESSSRSSLFEEREGPPLENTLTQEDDLYDHLLWQLHMMTVPDQIREIAELIIGNLNPDGFLAATVEEIQLMGKDSEEAEPGPDGPDSPDGVQAVAGGAASQPDTVAEPTRQDPVAVSATSSDSAGLTMQSATGSTAGSVEPITEATGEAAQYEGANEGADSAEAEGAESLDSDSDEAAEDETDYIALEGGYPREMVQEALLLVRGLDPAGVACHDLRESLLGQLERLGEEEDSLAFRLVKEKWDLFAKRKFQAIAKDLGIPLMMLKPVVEVIANLETRPGQKFGSDRTHYVEPDVHVVRVGGEYVIQLNDSGLPRLRVSRAYRTMLRGMREKGSEAEAQQYIKEKMRSAIWLIKSLDQRQRTIYKVAKSIVQQQQAFLDHGVDHLRPMILRDVAEDIEMHESTVSRVVSNKYIHTPRGLLPMKFFFHSGIDREYGGDISSLTVKRKIQHLIQDENQKKPLSDSELMRILNREGIHIARRTVAKYRDELKIPSSTERKKIF